MHENDEKFFKPIYTRLGCCVFLVTWLILVINGFSLFFNVLFKNNDLNTSFPSIVIGLLFFPGLPIYFVSLMLAVFLAPLLIRILGVFTLLSTGRRGWQTCISCKKPVRPFKGARGGRWSGTAEQFMALPKIEADNAFVCEQCNAIICPVCLGAKTSALGSTEFVCVQCGHKPVKTIFR